MGIGLNVFPLKLQPRQFMLFCRLICNTVSFLGALQHWLNRFAQYSQAQIDVIDRKFFKASTLSAPEKTYTVFQNNLQSSVHCLGLRVFTLGRLKNSKSWKPFAICLLNITANLAHKYTNGAESAGAHLQAKHKVLFILYFPALSCHIGLVAMEGQHDMLYQIIEIGS